MRDARETADTPPWRAMNAAFERGERERAALRDLQRHRARLLVELVVGHHLVDEADLERLARASGAG